MFIIDSGDNNNNSMTDQDQDYEKFGGIEEDLLREICETGAIQEKLSDKSRLKELFEASSTCAGSEINSNTMRKTRKDFITRNSLKENYKLHMTYSASPVCKNRRCNQDENSSDYNDDIEVAELADLDEKAQNYMEKYSYETPQDIIENDLEEDSLNDSAPTAPTYDEDGEPCDPGYSSEPSEDIKKLSLKDLIYKLFLNIYNSEKDDIIKLKKEIFPKINENTQLDNYITYAISNCMDHVKDELQSFIKKNLKLQKKKSMITDSALVPFNENMDKYNELIDKIIDFYELFKCSINHIVEVWKEKLGHIEKLYEIFEFRHKKLFSINIWQDKEILSVMQLYFNQTCEKEEYSNRVEELRKIDEDLNENNQYNGKDVNNNGSKKQKKGNATVH